MRRKGTSICAAALIAIFTSMSVSAQTPVDLKLNNNIINTGASPFIDDGSTLVPLRNIANALGADKILWNDKEKSADVSYNGKKIKIYTNSTTAYIDNEKVIMPQKARIINSNTYVSVRFLADVLGADVNWNRMTHTVELTKQNHTVSAEYIENDYTSSDLDWLAKIVHAEAEGESSDGKIAVANVVLNRTKSKEFPNTIYGVIFDKKYGVQFTPVANGKIYNTPSKDSYHAAKRALYGENLIDNCLYFCNLKISTNFWISNNRKFYKSIGNHSFYL